MQTLIVRRVPLRAPRRVTTQFAPERVTVWPWLIVLAVLVLAGIGGRLDLTRDTHLESQAGSVLRLLP